MLNMRYTRIFHTEHRDVQSGVVIPEEGLALVFVKDAGLTKVRPSTGVAGEKFAGISLARNVPPSFYPSVQEDIIPTSLSYTLNRAPIAGQLLVKVGGVSKTVVATTPASAAEVMLSGTVLSFAAGEAGKSLFVQYIYEPTVVEASTFVGQTIIGGTAFQTLGNIGIIIRGDICTNYYDTAVDWTAAMDVKLGANGKFTTTGTGITVPNALVMNSPGVDNPMLTLRLN